MTDTERLDFLLSNSAIGVSGPSPAGVVVVWDQSNGLTIAGRGSNAREAIDNAIAKASGTHAAAGKTEDPHV